MTQATSGTGQVVLVVADQHDLPADAIIVELARLGVPTIRLDPSLVPLHMDCTLRGDGWHGQIQAGDGRTVELDRIASVCWRWHHSPPGHPGIADPVQRAWAAAEDTHALRGVLRSLPVLWMNHPDALAVCENSKPVQLVHAVQVGLPVPDTLVTTSGEAADRWADRRWGCEAWPDRRVIYKAFDACHRRGTTRHLVPARAVPEPPPTELCGAAQFQSRIPGTPLRVILVGRHLFAASVTDARAGSEVDWRPRQNTDLLQWRPVELPEATAAGLRALMRRWAITYGAFDLIAPPDGSAPVFLECNPSGQWGAVETATGMPISAAIAATLAATVTLDDQRTGGRCPS